MTKFFKNFKKAFLGHSGHFRANQNVSEKSLLIILFSNCKQVLLCKISEKTDELIFGKTGQGQILQDLSGYSPGSKTSKLCICRSFTFQTFSVNPLLSPVNTESLSKNRLLEIKYRCVFRTMPNIYDGIFCENSYLEIK